MVESISYLCLKTHRLCATQPSSNTADGADSVVDEEIELKETIVEDHS